MAVVAGLGGGSACAPDLDEQTSPPPPPAVTSSPSGADGSTAEEASTMGEQAAAAAAVASSRRVDDASPSTASTADDVQATAAGERAETGDAEAVDQAARRGAELLGWNEEHLARIDRVQPLIVEACVRRSLDVDLVNAVIWVESKFNPKARGPAGARGLMQIMPSTARGIAKRIDRKPRYYDPGFNIDAGTWLLRRLIDKADGDVTRALVAYNRGWAYVTRHDEADEPWSEGLVAYLERVERAREAFEHSQFAGAAAFEDGQARAEHRIRPHAGPGGEGPSGMDAARDSTSTDDPAPAGDGGDVGADSAQTRLH